LNQKPGEFAGAEGVLVAPLLLARNLLKPTRGIRFTEAASV
jgi:hypothetical protein